MVTMIISQVTTVTNVTAKFVTRLIGDGKLKNVMAVTIKGRNNAYFVVSEASGQKLGYFDFEEEPGRRSAAKLLTKDEARRIAADVAKLPERIAQGRLS